MKNTSITSNGITPGQKKQVKRFIQDLNEEVAEIAVEKAGFNKDSLQCFLGRGDEYRSAMLEVAIAKVKELSVSNRFANEEVASKLRIPLGLQKTQRHHGTDEHPASTPPRHRIRR